MCFRVEKCQVMHVGLWNTGHVYSMDGTILKTTVEDRDIGVSVSNSLKPGATDGHALPFSVCRKQTEV